MKFVAIILAMVAAFSTAAWCDGPISIEGLFTPADGKLTFPCGDVDCAPGWFPNPDKGCMCEPIIHAQPSMKIPFGDDLPPWLNQSMIEGLVFFGEPFEALAELPNWTGATDPVSLECRTCCYPCGDGGVCCGVCCGF